jgi:predicted nucleotidyltransferase
MALSKDEVINIVKGFLSSSCQKHNIRHAYIFGSFAKGTAKDYSDIDLAIILETLSSSEESPFDEDFEIFHEAQQYNSLLEVVCFLQDVFDRDGGTLIKRIKKEGIRII